MLSMCSRVEQLWATLCTGLTTSGSPFLFLSPFVNTLVDCRSFLRSEVIHAGRGGDRVCSNATHSHPQHLRVAWRDWGGVGGSTLSLAHMEAMMEDGGSPCSTTAISPWLSCSDATLYTTNPCNKLTMASRVHNLQCCHGVAESILGASERTILSRKCHCSLIAPLLP